MGADLVLQAFISASKLSHVPSLKQIHPYILVIISDETGRHQVHAYDNIAKDQATKAKIKKKKSSFKTDIQQKPACTDQADLGNQQPGQAARYI